MQSYFPYITGMLTNIGQLPLMRIHTMLGMFVQTPEKYAKTPEELEDFLETMVRQGRLELFSGLYRLKSLK